MKPWRLVSIVSVLALAVLAGCGSSDDGASSDGANGTYGDASTTGTTLDGGSGGSSGGGGGDGGGGGGGGGADGGKDGGGSLCLGAADDPAAAALISGYMDKLPYNAPTGATRSTLIDTIIEACQVFGPATTNAGWQRQYCFAHLVSAIEKESSYNATLSVKDAYGTRTIGTKKANDPTVGLLQIRFSSTVHDFVQQGPLDRLACVGCTFPADFATHASESGDSDFWAVSGPTANMSVMTNPRCNVGLGAWYYYLNATGNGNPTTATYLAGYCSGKGTAANLVTGLRSHLEGPSGGKGVISDMTGLNALQSTDSGAYQYVTNIKTWFDGMVGPAGGTHPFFLKLAPSTSEYCRK